MILFQTEKRDTERKLKPSFLPDSIFQEKAATVWFY